MMCRRSQLRLQILFGYVFILLFSSCSVFAATVTVEPQITRSIKGINDLNRIKYFNLGASASNYESKIAKCELPNRYDYYTHDLEMTFGRALGAVFSEKHWGNSMHELGTTGTVDINLMISLLNPSNNGASTTFMNDYGPNLNIATHDRAGTTNYPGQYPDFMEKYNPYEHDATQPVEAYRWIPLNTSAAADIAVTLLKYGRTDFTRPGFYEIRNEPHWKWWSDPVFIDLHLDIHTKAKQENLSTEIGGPCYSVGYFYKNSYDDLSQITNFIDNTNCSLDFYSFHTYDYMSWSGTIGAGGDFVGRITSGLPLDGVIDAIVNDTVNNHGKEISLVFSEQGGYVSNGNGDQNASDIANYYFPFTGTPNSDEEWEWIMKKRSIINFIMVNSAIGNTMAYMNHPHIVKKGVPFILEDSAGWDPEYYSSLLVSKWFNSSVSTYSESKLIHFFEYFRDVRGRRIKSYCDDPDLQHHAFVDQDKLVLLFNNTSMVTTPLDFQITDPDTVNNIMIRRLGRNTEFTPYLTESPISDLTGIQIQPLEAIVVFVEYNSTIAEIASVDEVPYYGDKTEVVMPGSTVETFTVNIPEYAQADYGILRIATGRPSGTDHDITVVLNGQPLSIPVEDSASRTDNGNEYGTLKSIKVDGSLLQAVNTVQVSFSSDGLGGGVGSVVIRAGISFTTSLPYSGSPVSLPGTIEAEEYDLGGEGLAYHDTTTGNTGGDFRTDDVDITDQYGGYVVAWTANGEWLKYTVDAAAGRYDITVRAATGLNNQSATLTLDDNVLGTFNVPNMGWSTFQTITLEDIDIPATSSGALQLDFNGAINIDWIEFAPAPSSPYSGTPISLPGKLQVEQYDVGFNGIAYYDTTAGNTGGDFRSDDVDITDQYGGYVIAWTTDEEWLKYTVDATAGTYDITVWASTGTINRNVTLTLDGNTLGTINIPNMGWSTFGGVTLTDVVIPAASSGALQLDFNGGINVDWIDFVLLKGDADFSGAVDSDDLYLLASQWLSDCLLDSACSDMDYSGKVDFSDFMILSRGWMMP